MDVMIAGGGTGGHLFPGIALAQELRRRDPHARIIFVGTDRGVEKGAVPKAGFDLALLPVAGLRGRSIGAVIGTVMRLPWALLKAMWLVVQWKPQAAVSCGGYAAGPAVLAAFLCGVPCFVLEQNAVAGTTNRILGWCARRVLASLPVTGFRSEKVWVLGNPVRADLLRVREISYKSPKETGRPLRLLVFGGSQGARALNDVMVEAMSQLSVFEDSIEVYHQTGKADFDRIRASYEFQGFGHVKVLPFIDDMAKAYEMADIVLCRAGATTIAELTVCGRSAILVPFPFAVDDHQTANADTLVQEGAAIQLKQKDLSAAALLKIIESFMNNEEALVEMASKSWALGRPDAVEKIADAIDEEVEHV